MNGSEGIERDLSFCGLTLLDVSVEVLQQLTEATYGITGILIKIIWLDEGAST